MSPVTTLALHLSRANVRTPPLEKRVPMRKPDGSPVLNSETCCTGSNLWIPAMDAQIPCLTIRRKENLTIKRQGKGRDAPWREVCAQKEGKCFRNPGSAGKTPWERSAVSYRPLRSTDSVPAGAVRPPRKELRSSPSRQAEVQFLIDSRLPQRRPPTQSRPVDASLFASDRASGKDRRFGGKYGDLNLDEVSGAVESAGALDAR